MTAEVECPLCGGAIMVAMHAETDPLAEVGFATVRIKVDSVDHDCPGPPDRERIVA